VTKTTRERKKKVHFERNGFFDNFSVNYKNKILFFKIGKKLQKIKRISPFFSPFFFDKGF